MSERVPEGWKKVKLKDISQIKTGSSNVQDAVENGKYPFFDRSSEVKKSNKYLFDTEAVIVPGEGTDFEPKYYSGKFDLHQRAYALFGLKRIDGKFLYYFTHLAKKELIQHSVGTTVMSLRLPHFQSLNVLLPPLPEQRKIAEILETIDNAIEKTDKIIEKYKRIKQGLMQELLTKGIDENGQIRSERTHRFKDSPLGRIPQEWEVINFHDLFDVIDNRGRTPPFSEEGNIPYLSAENIKHGRVVPIFENFVTEKIYKRYMRGFPSQDYILFTTEAPLGEVSLAPKMKFCFAQRVIAIKPKKGYSEYYFYLIQHEIIQKQLNNLLSGTTVKGISATNLRKVIFFIPPLPEQRRIASILSQIDKVIESEQRYKEKPERVKQGLMEDLLTGKTRVNKLLKEGEDNKNRESNIKELSCL